MTAPEHRPAALARRWSALLCCRAALTAALALAGCDDPPKVPARPPAEAPRAAAAPGAPAPFTAAESARALEAASWAQAGRDLPNLLYALEDRLDDLRGGKTPPGGAPPGLDPASLESARAALAELEAGWTRAQALAAGGDVTAGLAEAQALAARARELHARLGGPAGPARRGTVKGSPPGP